MQNWIAWVASIRAIRSMRGRYTRARGFRLLATSDRVGTGPACWAGCQNRAAVGEACDGPREIPQQWFLARRSDFGPLSSAKRMPDKRSIERSSLKSPIASAAVCDPCTSSTD